MFIDIGLVADTQVGSYTEHSISRESLLVEPAGAGETFTPDRRKYLVRDGDRVEEH